MTTIESLDAGWMRDNRLPDPGDQGKDGRGQVLVVGGQVELAGAAMLAGVAALRAGAGKLQVAVAREAVAPLTVALPEARILALPEHEASAATTKLHAHVRTCDALLIGPGMLDDADGLAAALLTQEGQAPIVLDAGALRAVAVAPRAGLILTPNAGEMAQLLGWERSRVEQDPLAAGREAARRHEALIVMKGASTLIVAPDGRLARYAGGGPGLGISGSGDVLGGLITGLLARGAPAFEAAAWGVYLHGEAGARLAARIGRLGFLAREVADEVPGLMSAF